MARLRWLLTRQEEPKQQEIERGATEVEAAYLQFVRDFWMESGYSADTVNGWIPTSYSLTRVGTTSAGTLWRASDCWLDVDQESVWAPSCYILDGADGAEVVVTKSKDGGEVRVVEQWEDAVAAHPEAFAEDTDATILKHLNGELVKPVEKSEYRVIKSDETQRYTLGVAYPADQVDSHGDFTTPEELEATAWNFMGDVIAKGLEGAGTDHVDGTDGAGRIVESYIYRGPDWVDAESGKTIAKSGDWMLGAIWNEAEWESIVKGERTGWSIQGIASVDDDITSPAEAH